jgi:outer membrane receptor for ferrienterochelin and colicins
MKHLPPSTTTLTIASILLLQASPLLAQDSNSKQNANESSSTKSQQVEIKAKSEVELARKSATAKTIITSDELNRFGDTNITDAMKRVPGVSVVKGVMQLPGMSSSYTQVLVDGQPPRAFTFNINDIPMNSIDRVEIYQLGSAEFSSQGIAGTINIVLKKIPRTAQQALKLGLSYNNGTSPHIEWLGSDKKDNFEYSLSFSAAKNRGINLSDVLTSEVDRQTQALSQNEHKYRIATSSQRFFIKPVIQYRDSNGLSLNSSSSVWSGQANDRAEQTFDLIQGRSRPIQQISSHSAQHYKGGSTSIKLSNSFFTDAKLDLTMSFNGGHNVGRGTDVNYKNPSQIAYILNGVSDSHGGGASNTLKISAPSNAEHDLVAGWDLTTKVGNDKRMQNISGPDYQLPLLSQEDNHSVVDTLAMFAQDEWKFRKDSSAYFGLRWESIRVKSEVSGQAKVESTSSVWSPIAQTLWQLNDENADRVRLGISRTFKAPQIYALTSPKIIGSNNSIDNPGMRGNPLLRPELAWSLQTSYEHNDKADFRYSIKAVVRRITDLHRMQISYFDNAWWRRFVNAGNGSSKVLSIDTHFPLKRFFDDAPNIDLSFYAGRTWSSVSTFAKPENLLTPGKIAANMSLDYKSKDLPLTLGASVRYQDSNPIRASDNQRNIGHASVDMDAYSLWKISPKTSLRFSIDNVLKRRDLFAIEYTNDSSIIMDNISTRTYRSLRLNFEHSF